MCTAIIPETAAALMTIHMGKVAVQWWLSNARQRHGDNDIMVRIIHHNCSYNKITVLFCY